MSNPLTRWISRPVNKPYRTAHLRENEDITLDDDGYLVFSPDDRENPQNWTKLRRWMITLPAVLLVMNATFASSAPSGCFPSISESFGVSQEAAGLTITLFLLGYVAGPLIFAPLSEFFGRRYIFYITFSAYIAFNFLCAFAPNFGSLLVGRFLSGTFVSSPLTNSPGVIADIWNPLDRGLAMAAFSGLLWIGPALGPLVAGFLQLTKDWRWSFYVLLMLGGISLIPMFTIPETHAPTILVKKAKRIRSANIPGFENVKARSEDQGSLVEIYKVALLRPWVILFDTISFLCAIYLSVVYTLLYMLFTIYPIVFQEKRGWNAGVGELPLLGTVCGAVLGAIYVFWETQHRNGKIKRGEMKMEDITPEDRLTSGKIGGIGFAVTMFWFAWSAEYNSVHWIVPTIAGAFLASSLLLIFVAYLTYIVDSYLFYAASAMAANTIARSACGAAAPLFTNQMFKALGVGGGGSLIGGVAAVLAIIPFMFARYGRQIRIRSKFAPTDTKEDNKVKDEEKNSAALQRDDAAAEEDGDGDGSTSSSASSTIADSEEHKQEKAAQRQEGLLTGEEVSEGATKEKTKETV